MFPHVEKTPTLNERELNSLGTSDLRDLMSALSNRSSVLRWHRPRPLAKLYGLRGPTAEQLAEYKAHEREWNSEYRAVQKMHKTAVQISNRRFYEANGK